MAQVPFSTKGDGRFRTVAHDQWGAPVEIAFMPDGKMVERRVLPDAYLAKLKAQAAHEREIQRPGSLGGTQRHKLKTFQIPAALAASLTKRLGPYRKNGKAWHAWIATHAPDLLSSGYRL